MFVFALMSKIACRLQFLKSLMKNHNDTIRRSQVQRQPLKLHDLTYTKLESRNYQICFCFCSPTPMKLWLVLWFNMCWRLNKWGEIKNLFQASPSGQNVQTDSAVFLGFCESSKICPPATSFRHEQLISALQWKTAKSTSLRPPRKWNGPDSFADDD